MAQLRAVAKSGAVSVTDFFTDPTNIFTAHENIGAVSPSTTTKFTVHYNLFGNLSFTQVEPSQPSILTAISSYSPSSTSSISLGASALLS